MSTNRPTIASNGPSGGEKNVGCFESNMCQAVVLNTAVRGGDVSGVAVDAEDLTG